MPAIHLARLAAVTLLFFGLAACSSDDDPAPSTGTTGSARQNIDIELGVVQSLSGTAQVYGESVVKGIELAVKEINPSGEVQITVETKDDKSEVQTGVDAVKSFGDSDVTAIIGPTLSNVALEAMKAAQEAGVPILGATTTAAGITDIDDYVFRIALTEAVVVPAMIERVSGDEQIEDAVLIFDSSDAFSSSSADAMRTGIEKIGASISAEIDTDVDDLEARMASLDKATIDAFLVTPLVDASAEIVKAIRAAGFEQPIVGGNSFNTLSIATMAGADIDGAYVGAAWNPGLQAEASKRFVAAYEKEYGSAPDQFAAHAFQQLRHRQYLL